MSCTCTLCGKTFDRPQGHNCTYNGKRVIPDKNLGPWRKNSFNDVFVPKPMEDAIYSMGGEEHE